MLQSKVGDSVKMMLSEKNITAVVYTDHANFRQRDEAREKELSSGKYKMISILKTLDPSSDEEQF